MIQQTQRMNKLLLKLVSLTNPLWKRLGADPYQLNLILDAKLKMDSRRPAGFGNFSSGGKKEVTFQDVILILVSLFIGGFLLFPIIAIQPTSLALIIFFTVFMVYLTLVVVSDFTHVLIDPRDNYIIFPRPVNDSTFTLSRTIHVGLYLSKLFVSMALPSLIYIPFGMGLVQEIVFFLLVILAVLMVIFFVNILYLLIIRLASPEKFKEIINYVQILTTVLIFGSQYIFPRLVDMDTLQQFNIFEKNWAYFLPVTWLAAIWELLIEQNTSTAIIINAALGILIPIIGMYLVVNVLAKHFAQKLFLSSQSGSKNTKRTLKEQSKANKRFNLRDLVCKDAPEAAAFDLSWALMKRSRDFKLKAYPGLAFIPIMFFGIFLNDFSSMDSVVTDLREGKLYILLAYLPVIALLGPINVLSFSEHHKASWFYLSTPLQSPGVILAGAFKAVIVRFYLPVSLLIYTMGVVIWGPTVIDDFLLAGLTGLGVVIGVQWADRMRLPFSHSWDVLSEGGNIAAGLLFFMITIGLGSLHYFFIINFWWLTLAGIVIAIISIRNLFRNLRAISWKNIQ